MMQGWPAMLVLTVLQGGYVGTGNVAAADAAQGNMWRATPGCMGAHVRLARLRGGLDIDAAASCEKASGEGPELCEKALLPDPLLEGRGRLQEAMGLMAGLDKEIEAAQSKLEELGDEESESCALETLEEQVEEQVPLEAGERMLKAMAPTAKGSTGKAQSATSVLRRVHSLEAQKTQLEVATHPLYAFTLQGRAAARGSSPEAAVRRFSKYINTDSPSGISLFWFVWKRSAHKL